MSRATDSNTLTGNIILHFYSFPKLHQQDEDYYKWDIENDYGKDNPFASQPAGSSTAPANTTQPLVADFVMTIKPVTSDLPTVVLGRTEDPQRNTYVFGDNLGYEAVEFKVKKENGGYYYKYRTEYESYPKDYENEWVSFQPKGDEIGINIYSNPRNTPSDQNGVSLTLINETDLKLRVYVNNEDKARPRLRIANMSGAVSVTER
jgi:type IV pilus assembly protein PilO